MDTKFAAYAVKNGIVDSQTADRLVAAYGEYRVRHVPTLNNAAHVAMFFGGMIAILGISMFVTMAFSKLHGQVIALSGAACFLMGIALAEKTKAQPIASSIYAAFALAAVPLFGYGMQVTLGMWDEVHGQKIRPYHEYHTIIDYRWLTLELLTLVVGAGMVAKYRLPFLMMPVAVTLWYLSMDLAQLIVKYEPSVYGSSLLGGYDSYRLYITMWIGIGILGLGYALDLVTKRDPDLGYWTYIAGTLAFWSGLTFARSGTMFEEWIYCGINVAMIFAGSKMNRGVLVVFGALGVFLHLEKQASRIFSDWVTYSIAHVVVGIGISIIALLYLKRREAATALKAA